MINELIKLATHLDKRGCYKEADYLDAVIKRYADAEHEAEGKAKHTSADLAEIRGQSEYSEGRGADSPTRE